MKRHPRPRIPTIDCPHCNARAIVRSSDRVTPLVRELRLQCDNPDCGHSFAAQLSVTRSLSPSACPNPAIHLPFGNRALRPRRSGPANDDTPMPANDDDPAAALAPDPMT